MQMLQINQVLDSWFNRSFKASKCKTLLKLASSRMRLLKNKRDIQLKQMRKELAQLLENGQESMACIRVEHIIREQNIMEAYDILEHFCELLIVRIPIMESQRECPLDLKEAIASLIFAAPRASDLPELLEVQSLFSFKYGREFVASATELQPECGVNRLVIEKLSTRAPTARMKLDLMREIAEEFNVEWDSSSTELEFAKTPEDLLDGPNHSVGPIQMSPIPFYVGDLHSQESTPAFSHKGGDYVFPPPKPVSSPTNTKPSDPIEEPKFVPFVVSSPHYETEAVPNRFYSPPRESSITQQSGLLEETLLQRTHSRTKSEGSMNLQDIIEAAEVAAESAEKAARAARAAAELCRSQMSSKSKKGKPQEESISQGTNSDVLSCTHPKGGLSPDSYDWTQDYEREKEQQKGIVHSEQTVNSNGCENQHVHLKPDDYDWTMKSSSNEKQEDSTHCAPEKSKAVEDVYAYDGEADNASLSLGRDHQSVDYGIPRFDDPEMVKVSEPFLRQPSLEDDPYYTYPNLFSRSSSG